MLYFLLKQLIRLSLRIFFRQIYIHHPERLQAQGPLLIVANHPNTFMDPLIVAALLPQKVHFLANGGIFKNRLLRKLWALFQMIPIYRKVDLPEGASPSEVNKRTFGKCFEKLAEDASILIFPEGTSIVERRLREIKTGTARIALGALEGQTDDFDVQILPIGLNYADATRFRSEVFVAVGKPISARQYFAQFQEKPIEAAQNLTKTIEVQLRRLVIDTQDAQEEALVLNIEKIYKNELFRKLHVPLDQKVSAFRLSKNLVEAVRIFSAKAPEESARQAAEIQDYLDQLADKGLSDELLSGAQADKNLLRDTLRILVALFWGFPLYLYGLLNNYLPYIIPSQVANLITKDEAYRAPIMMSTGIFTFGIFYGLQNYWAWSYWAWPYALLYTLSLPLSAFFAMYYGGFLQKTRGYWRLIGLFYKDAPLVAQLVARRQQILQNLENARQIYTQEGGFSMKS